MEEWVQWACNHLQIMNESDIIYVLKQSQIFEQIAACTSMKQSQVAEMIAVMLAYKAIDSDN